VTKSALHFELVQDDTRAFTIAHVVDVTPGCRPS